MFAVDITPRRFGAKAGVLFHRSQDERSRNTSADFRLLQHRDFC